MNGTDLTEVVAHERELLDPAVRADPQRAGALLHPDFLEFGRSGRSWNRANALAALAADPSVDQTFYDFDPCQVGADTVLITYRSSDGTRRSSLWVRDHSGWRVRFHQATAPIGDDYPVDPLPNNASTATRPAVAPAKPPQSQAVPVLAIRDAQSSLQWYSRLGFTEEWRHRFASGLPFYIGIARPDGARVHLSERGGDGGHASVVYLSVPDLEVAAQAMGLALIDNLPWGQDLEIQDPDGNRLRINQPDN